MPPAGTGAVGKVCYWIFSWPQSCNLALCVCSSAEEHLDLVTRWVPGEGSADSFPVRANVGRSFAAECCEAAGALFCRNVLCQRGLKGCFHVCGLEQH